MEPWLVKKGDDTQVNSRKRGVILHIFFITNPSYGHRGVCVITRGCQGVPGILCKWIGLFSDWGIDQGS